MTVRIQKPTVNIREKLAELERPIGINGQALMATDTPQQAFDLLGTRNRNRIINGDMRIDQRNNGAATTTHTSFPVDRWMIIKDTGSGSFTIQQSSTAPAGFYKSLLFTVGTAYTPSAGENNFLKYMVEGLILSDLNWGSSNAVPVTLSFWVRSSLTGTFGGSIRNGSSNRSYPFLYTVANANTFEYKTITVPGDVTGTWPTTNALSMEISWGLSVGSTFSGTANAWVGSNIISTSGAVNLTSTAGATWYITGVQLEVGKVATPFEYHNYAQELTLCQRYYEKSFEDTTVPANGPNGSSFSTEVGLTVGWAGHRVNYPYNGYPGRSTFARFRVPKRVPPTVSFYGNSNGYPYIYDTTNGIRWVTGSWGVVTNKEGFEWINEHTNVFQLFAFSHWTASAEL